MVLVKRKNAAYEKPLIREKEGFNHAKLIRKPFGVIEQVLEWCKHSLEDEWRWQLVELSSQNKDGEYIFYFDSEKDCISFLMKWG